MAEEITTTEAAELAGVTAWTIRKALTDGRLQGRRLVPRGVLVVDRESVLAAIRGGQLPAPSGRPRVPDPVNPRPSKRKNQGETPAEENALDAWTERALEEGEGNDGAS